MQGKESPCIVRVAVAAPLRQVFDYLPGPTADSRTLRPGTRVLVPFGRSSRVGLVIERSAVTQQATERLKPIEGVLDSGPLLDLDDLEALL